MNFAGEGCVLFRNTDMAITYNVFSYAKFAVLWTIPKEYFLKQVIKHDYRAQFCSKVLIHLSAVWLHYLIHFKSWHTSYIRSNAELASTGRFWSFSLQFSLLIPWLILWVKNPCVAGEFAASLWRQKNKSAVCIRLVVCCWLTDLSGGKFIYRNILYFLHIFVYWGPR